MSQMFKVYWPLAALAVIVAVAAGLAIGWVYLVPIFQAPDEPQHLDYALCVMEHGRPFRVGHAPRDAETNRYPNVYGHDYLCYFVHPYTHYLADRVDHYAVTFNTPAKMPPEYRTRDYFAALDRDAPPRDSVEIVGAPSMAFIYPCGYYAVLGAWMGLLRHATSSLSGLFFGARLFSVLLMAVGLVLSYGILRELRCRRGLSLALVACVGCFPLTTFVSSSIQPDNLSFALVSLCFFASLRLREPFCSTRFSGCGEEPPEGGTTKQSVAWYSVLGVGLGLLLLTKNHVFFCVTLPVLAMLAVQWYQCPPARARRGLLGAVLVVPSLLAGLLYFETVRRSDYHPLQGEARGDTITGLIEDFGKCIQDYYAGTTHQSFWGTFGWMDAPLVIRGARTDAVVKFIVQAAVWLCVVLTLVRLEQVLSRLWRLARRGRGRAAARIAVSNVPINSFLLFTLLMIVLYTVTRNGFLAQGRHWFPMLLPTFLTSVVYAPKALRLPAVRRAVSAALLTGLLVYCAVGSYYARAAILQRYYLDGGPLTAVSLPLQPAESQEMEFADGVARGRGERSFVGFRLPRPEVVKALQIRFVLERSPLTKEGPATAATGIFWQQSGKTSFYDGKHGGGLAWLPDGRPRRVTVPVGEAIDQIRIHPDWRPCGFRFKIEELRVLQEPSSH